MFGTRLQYPPPSTFTSNGSPARFSPLLNMDGTLRAARADTRYALPRVSSRDLETEMVYICQAPDVRGKFNVKRSIELGVPAGPMRGILASGKDVQVPDPTVQGGMRIVKSEDCLAGGTLGAVSWRPP
jgi:ribonuclease Z